MSIYSTPGSQSEEFFNSIDIQAFAHEDCDSGLPFNENHILDFGGDADELRTLCEIFILEHNISDDTDPDLIRHHVWRTLNFFDRFRLRLIGVKP